MPVRDKVREIRRGVCYSWHDIILYQGERERGEWRDGFPEVTV